MNEVLSQLILSLMLSVQCNGDTGMATGDVMVTAEGETIAEVWRVSHVKGEGLLRALPMTHEIGADGQIHRRTEPATCIQMDVVVTE